MKVKFKEQKARKFFNATNNIVKAIYNIRYVALKRLLKGQKHHVKIHLYRKETPTVFTIRLITKSALDEFLIIKICL